MFFPPVFPVREKAIETNNPRTTNALPELKEREREKKKERFIKRRRETERDLVLYRRKKEERYVVSFPPLLLKLLLRYPHQREACRFGKQKSIDPIISLLPRRRRRRRRGVNRRRKRKNERNDDKTPHHIVCACVVCVLLRPRVCAS